MSSFSNAAEMLPSSSSSTSMTYSTMDGGLICGRPKIAMYGGRSHDLQTKALYLSRFNIGGLTKFKITIFPIAKSRFSPRLPIIQPIFRGRVLNLEASSFGILAIYVRI